MHPAVLSFVEKNVQAQEVENKVIVEIGSLDVNGSVRPTFEYHKPLAYFGVDITEGPGVDIIVGPTSPLPFRTESVDFVISTGALEHCENFHHVISEGKRILKQGGFFILTTVSPGFPHHCPPDYWRFTPAQLKCLFIDMVTISFAQTHEDVFIKAFKIANTGTEDLSFIQGIPINLWPINL